MGISAKKTKKGKERNGDGAGVISEVKRGKTL